MASPSTLLRSRDPRVPERCTARVVAPLRQLPQLRIAGAEGPDWWPGAGSGRRPAPEQNTSLGEGRLVRAIEHLLLRYSPLRLEEVSRLPGGIPSRPPLGRAGVGRSS